MVTPQYSHPMAGEGRVSIHSVSVKLLYGSGSAERRTEKDRCKEGRAGERLKQRETDKKRKGT